jgi:hypothetical protein
MKSKLFLQLACLLFLLLGFQFSFASFGGGSVMGRVIDPDTKAPASGVTVVLECLGNQTTVTSNDSGYYYASNLPSGIYTVTAYYMSNRSTVTDVKIVGDVQKVVDVELNVGLAINEVPIVTTRVHHDPIIDPYEITTARIPREVFTKMAITKVADITGQQPGVTDINGAFYVRGAREGSLVYYIDGGKVMDASGSIPLCGLETYSIFTGFIPPKYGDTVGGVVVLETRNYFTASRE